MSTGKSCRKVPWVNTTVIVLAMAAALCLVCDACVANEAQALGGAEVEQASATTASGNVAGAERKPDDFPLPIWRNRTFDDVNDLAGVLLKTSDGPVQIKELKWGVDEAGQVYICYVSGYLAGGETVQYGVADECLDSLKKEDFLGSAMTWSDTLVIKSFELGTDYDGYLAIVDPVFKTGEAAKDASDVCHMETVYVCRKAGCTGECGFGTDGVPVSKGTIPQLHPVPLVPEQAELVMCKCLGDGATGKCAVQQHRECQGTCVSGECTMDSDDGGKCVCADVD